MLKVKTVFGGYNLPAGLPEGASVKLLRFDHGYWDVEYEGKVFHVFCQCLQTGEEYQLPNGRWVCEQHPLVLAVKRGERARRRQRG